MSHDSELRSESLWTHPQASAERPVVSSFVEQVSGNRNSCYLASLLNALIARQAIEPALAASLHAQFTSGRAYEDFWLPRRKVPQNWTDNPRRTMDLLAKEAGVDVPFVVKRLPPYFAEAESLIDRVLEEGMVIVGDDCTHCVATLRPEDTPRDHALVVDPLQPQEHKLATTSQLEAYFRRGEGNLTVV